MTTATHNPNLANESAGHDPFLAHHFESQEQQFDAGKLGMWIFLVTEVLFFGGLFVAYAVYRSNHPEVFIYAHQYLNKVLGALNTIVLLCSSLTMAWAVRCAQLNQRRGLAWCLALTLGCAGFFLGVKAVEYTAKWNEGLLWAGNFRPEIEQTVRIASPALLVLSSPALIGLVAGLIVMLGFRHRRRSSVFLLAATVGFTAIAFFAGTGVATAIVSTGHHEVHAEGGVAETTDLETQVVASSNGATTDLPEKSAATEPPRLAGVFFSIYYAMTGVHAIHILAGMGVIAWLLHRALRGDFSAGYFGPVDFVGLYWHLVDLVWIYLFPLLYLIH